MTLRIEIFGSVSIDPNPDRAFVAILQAVSIGPKGRQSISANMTFYAPTAKEARSRAESWLKAEQDKREAAEAAAIARADARRKRDAA